jgi:hypothetical protein
MKKKNHKILLLAAVGAGAFFLYRNASASGLAVTTSSGTTAGNLATAAAGATATGLDYSSDATNTAKLQKWIAGEPNATSRASMTNFISTITAANRALMANYYDYINNGYNENILSSQTIAYMNTVAALKVGFHL